MKVVPCWAWGCYKSWRQAATVSLLSALKHCYGLGTLKHITMICHHKEKKKALLNLALFCGTEKYNFPLLKFQILNSSDEVQLRQLFPPFHPAEVAGCLRT